MLIVIEGADGCGKDSVAEAVALRIGGKKMSFPNDSGYTGPAIRSYLRKEWTVCDATDNDERVGPATLDMEDMSALAFQCLQLANRLEVADVLSNAAGKMINPGKVPEMSNIVLARYNPSTMVYGQLDGLPREWISKTCSALPQADINILLNAPAGVCMERRAKRDGAIAPERYEGKLDATRRIVELYRDLWWVNEFVPGWFVADATQPFDDVVRQITDFLHRQVFLYI